MPGNPLILWNPSDVDPALTEPVYGRPFTVSDKTGGAGWHRRVVSPYLVRNAPDGFRCCSAISLPLSPPGKATKSVWLMICIHSSRRQRPAGWNPTPTCARCLPGCHRRKPWKTLNNYSPGAMRRSPRKRFRQVRRSLIVYGLLLVCKHCV